MSGTLYIVATPLGNLEDITLRALRVLGEVSLIATEDTRTTGRLLKHFDIRCPMVSYSEHNKITRLDKITAALAQGEDVALVSEAGTPLLSDPGYELVQAVLAQERPVVPIPGPSAITAALSAAGLPPDRFLFAGFLPRKGGERRRRLEQLRREQATLVLFESPHRLRAALADMVAVLGGEWQVAVCRELTKLHEEIWRGTLAGALAEWTRRDPRGECSVVVEGAPSAPAWDAAMVETAIREALASGSRSRQVAREVSALSGWSKRDVYALVQQLKEAGHR